MTESPAPQASKKKSDLGPRVLTSVLMLPPLLALLIWGPHWGWAALIAAATAVGLDELYGMLMKDEAPLVRRVCVAIGTLFFVALYLFVGAKPMLELPVPQAEFVLASLSVGMWAFFLFHLMRPRKIEWVAKTIAASLSGLLYVSLSFAFLALLKRDFPETNGAWVLLLLAMTWMSDTGAYFTGRAFGKHRLAPIVSPKKSIEGAVGGMLSTILAAFAIRAWMLPELALWSTLLLAVVSNFLGQAGDLCESLLKRSSGVKDSGSIVYGHGGVLDRMDAVLFSAPWVYFFAIWLA